MNILVLAQQFFPDSVGGSARVAFEQAKHLQERGHTITVIAPRIRKELKQEETIDGLSVVRYGNGKPSLLGQSMTDIWLLPKTLESVLVKEDFDIVMAHQPTVAFAALPLIEKIPLLYVFHASVPKEVSFQGLTGQYRWIKNFAKGIFLRRLTTIEKEVMEECDHIVVLSHYSKELVETLYPIVNGKVSRIHTGIDTNIYAPSRSKALMRSRLGVPEDCTMLLTVRRLVPRMGLLQLIESFARLALDFPDARLYIVGEGPLYDELQKKIKDEDMVGRVMLTGRVRETDLPMWYKAADVFVLSTQVYEGLGIATLEALSCGLPVLGTPIGATVELLQEVDEELLFASASVEGMEEGMRKFLGEKISDASVGGRARDFVKREFTWEKAVVELENELTHCSKR